jgi:putative PIN family toxin of toxin-antitoxin system
MTANIKAVIDPSVLVAAAIGIDAGRRTAARTLVEDALLRRKRFGHVTSSPILYEFGDVLSRIGIFAANNGVVRFVDLLARTSLVLNDVQGVVMGCRDADDDKVLEAAMNGNARYIVSRDKDLLEAAPREKYAITKTGPGIRRYPIEVVTVERFLYDILGYPRAVSFLWLAEQRLA